MRKKIDPSVRNLMEKGFKRGHRGVFVIVGDRARDQVVSLFNLWNSIRQIQENKNSGLPKILWCYKNELGFSSQQKKRMKELSKQKRQGLYENESSNPFELFLKATDINYCYYKETNRVLGQTYDFLILQDFEALTPNILCRTVETVRGGGLIIFMLKAMSSLRKLYSLTMDVHTRYKTSQVAELSPLMNERMMVSLAISGSCIFIDDEMNLLNVSELNEQESCESSKKDLGGLLEKYSKDKLLSGVLSLSKSLDQAQAVLSIVESVIDHSSQINRAMTPVIFLTAARGRGKSAALGLSVAASLFSGISQIHITAPSIEALNVIGQFCELALVNFGLSKNSDFEVEFGLAGNIKSISVVKKEEICGRVIRGRSKAHFWIFNELPNSVSGLFIIDEAASIPLPKVKETVLRAKCPVLITSTVNGYEGTGRSLSLKLVSELRSRKGSFADRILKELSMNEPIRYQESDPVEEWLNKFLCLSMTEPVALKSTLPDPANCRLYLLNKATLLSCNRSTEKFLASIWSLFVSSHYKNSPNDLQLLADAPNHYLCVLLNDISSKEDNGLPDVIVAAQIVFERGNLAMERSQHASRPAGDLVPWTLSDYFLDPSFLEFSGLRIVRIATHPKAERMGFASELLKQLRDFFKEEISSEKTNWEDFSAERGIQSSDTNRLSVRKNLPPLLKEASKLNPPKISYISSCFGVTKELYNFWTKNKYVGVYMRNSQNEQTGEHSIIVVNSLNEDELDFSAFQGEFRKRLIRLLNSEFRLLDPFLAHLLLFQELKVQNRDESMERVTSIFSLSDLKRLEAYSNNLSENNLIRDLFGLIGESLFMGELGSWKPAIAQSIILIVVCLQKSDFDRAAHLLRMEVSQVMAIFNKIIKKATQSIKEITEKKISRELNLEKEASQATPLNPIALKKEEFIGESFGVLNKRPKIGKN